MKQEFPGYKPTKFHNDYELAIIKSIEKCFPDAKICGCLFHFTQV